MCDRARASLAEPVLSGDGHRRHGIRTKLVFGGAEPGLRLDGLIPGDGLAAVDGFAADDARSGSIRRRSGLVDRVAGEDAGDQVLVLLLVGAGRGAAEPPAARLPCSIRSAQLLVPFVPMTASPTMFSQPLIWRHWLNTVIPPGYSNSTAK